MAISRLSLTISAPIILISALAIGLTVFLNVGKLERTLGEVEASRLRFTLGDLRENLETGLDLGLSVKGLGNAQAAIDFEARHDRDILSIDVLDAAGAVAFHTGAPAPNVDLGHIKGRDWLGRDAGAIVAGTKLSDNLGVGAGAVVLRYARRGHDGFVADIARRLTLAAALAFGASGLILLAGIDLLVRRMEHTFRAMEAALCGATHHDSHNRNAAALVDKVNLTTLSAMYELDAAKMELAEAGGGA